MRIAALARGRDQALEQEAAKTLALVLVEHGDRELGRIRRVGHPDQLADGCTLPAAQASYAGPDRIAVPAVGLRERAQLFGSELALRAEEAVIAGARRQSREAL